MLARQEVRRGGGELYGEVIARTAAFARTVVSNHPGQRVLLVSHGAAIRAMITGVLGLDLAAMHSLGISSNTALTWLRYEHSTFFLDRYNDAAHLEEHDE
jgi:broad specificity phosphatase PhoE